jgi:elongation factor 3
MWNRPHLLVLDEPTNYLDREALGALTQAIKNFAGGVLIISHNAEFVNALCSEKWEIEGGVCTITGAAEEGKVKSQDQKTKMKKVRSSEGLSKTAMSVEGNEHKGAGCTNQSMADYKLVMNPKKLEPLTAKEQKKLGRLAAVAGKSIEDYVKTINSSSPEWKWL